MDVNLKRSRLLELLGMIEPFGRTLRTAAALKKIKFSFGHHYLPIPSKGAGIQAGFELMMVSDTRMHARTRTRTHARIHTLLRPNASPRIHNRHTRTNTHSLTHMSTSAHTYDMAGIHTLAAGTCNRSF